MNKVIFIIGVENFERSEWTVSKLSQAIDHYGCMPTTFSDGFEVTQYHIDMGIEDVYILNETLRDDRRYYIVPEKE